MGEWKNHVNNAGRTAAESFNAAYRFNKDKQEWHHFATFLDKFMSPPKPSPLPAPTSSMPKDVLTAGQEPVVPSAFEANTSPPAPAQPFRGAGGELQEKLQQRYVSTRTRTLQFENDHGAITTGVCKLIFANVA